MENEENKSENPKAPNPVAVIAVHGVADQKADETAACVSDLLIGLESATNGKGKVSYGGFEREELRVALEGMKIPDSIKDKDAWGKEIYEQFEHYDPQDGAYNTLRLEGLRSEADENGNWIPDREVHVYEMHWGDLSRVKNSFLSLLVGIYRLLFQLVWIGVTTVKNWSHPPAKNGWPVFVLIHRIFAWSLTRMIPIFNLAMLTMALTLAAGCFIPANGKDLPVVAGVLSGLLATVVSGSIFGALLYWKPPFLKFQISWGGLFGATAFTGITVGLLVGFFGAPKWAEKYQSPDLAAQHFTSVATWLLVSLLFVLIVLKLRHRHPRIWIEGMCAWIVVTVLFALGRQIYIPEWPLIASSGTFALIILSEILKYLWLFVFLFASLAALANIFLAFCWRYSSRESRKDAQARFGTALIATTLPSLTVLFLNIVLWIIILMPIEEGLLDKRKVKPLGDATAKTELVQSFSAAKTKLPASETLTGPTGLLKKIESELRKHNKLSYFAKEGLSRSVPTSFKAVFGVFLFVGLYALWIFFPSVSAEFNLWKLFQKLTKEHDSVFSKKLGKNLSNAYTKPIWHCLILMAGITVAMFVCMLDNILSKTPYLPADSHFLKVIVVAVVVILAQNFIPSKLRSAIRAATDVGLDVTSYLSRTPKKATVRAQVLSRFSSLLKTICEWRKPGSPDSSGYSRIVILSHSQGTVIATDLLRLLNDKELEKVNGFDFLNKIDKGDKNGGIDLRLFTMGSPLRQLYGWRFPETFGWACPNPAFREYNRIDRDGWTYPEMWRWQSGACQKCESSHGPDPDELRGIRYWWNVYRSADYVGRYLWHPETEDPDRPDGADPFEPVKELDIEEASIYPKIGKRTDGHPRIREYCIGPGGHTHYWDSQAPEVSIDLDRLIGLDNPDLRPLKKTVSSSNP